MIERATTNGCLPGGPRTGLPCWRSGQPVPAFSSLERKVRVMAGWERARLHHQGDVVTLRLRGDFDVTTAARLRTALMDAYRLEPAVLILSLHEVSFLDAVTVGVLASARRRLRTIGCQLRIEGSKPYHARVFELAGLASGPAVLEVPRARAPALDRASSAPQDVDGLLLI